MIILICILTAILIGLCVVAWSRVVERRSAGSLEGAGDE